MTEDDRSEGVAILLVGGKKGRHCEREVIGGGGGEVV